MLAREQQCQTRAAVHLSAKLRLCPSWLSEGLGKGPILLVSSGDRPPISIILCSIMQPKALDQIQVYASDEQTLHAPHDHQAPHERGCPR